MRRRTAIGSSGLALTFPYVSKAVEPPKIKIGQIGLGHPHAHGKLDAIRKLSSTYELVGVVEPNHSLRKSIRDVKFIPEEELLGLKDLQAVAVETAVEDLAKTATRVIEAGCHLHLDKPAGPNLSDFQKLHQSAASRKLTIQMGYMLRYNPAFQFLFKAVHEGWFGEIMEIDAMMGKKASPDLRKELAIYKGGGFFELACHILDAAMYVLGSKPDKAQGFNLRTQKSSGDSFADNQLVVLKYPRATATLRCNHNDPFGFPRRRFNIAGTQGGMEIKQLESGHFTLYLDRSRGNYQRGTHSVQLEGGRSYVPEFEDLAKIIRGEKKLSWTPQHDLAVQETLLRVCEML